MKKYILKYAFITGLVLAFSSQTAMAAQKHGQSKEKGLNQSHFSDLAHRQNIGQNIGQKIGQKIVWPIGAQAGAILQADQSGTTLMAQAGKGRISASKAKSVAMRSVRGAKFVNVALINSSTYRVRLQQKNGRIIDVYIDAYSGHVKN